MHSPTSTQLELRGLNETIWSKWLGAGQLCSRCLTTLMDCSNFPMNWQFSLGPPQKNYVLSVSERLASLLPLLLLSHPPCLVQPGVLIGAAGRAEGRSSCWCRAHTLTRDLWQFLVLQGRRCTGSRLVSHFAPVVLSFRWVYYSSRGSALKAVKVKRSAARRDGRDDATLAAGNGCRRRWWVAT